MRPCKRFLSLLFVTLIFTISSFAQQSSTVLKPGYWTFGINAGKAYQSSDIRASAKGYGLGLTLGKSLYYRPEALLSFELRSRLLFTRSYGLDPFRSYAIKNNAALNGTGALNYLEYPENYGVEKGFVFQNHRTSLGELGLEGVFTFNKLKENTGIKASLYGGAGLDWYHVMTNQANQEGSEYYEAYASINDRGPTGQILKNLRSTILDDTYESNADGFDSGWGKVKLMPSVGAEVGFQVTPKFSIDFGHRMTFSGTNLLDGHQWEDNTKDIHHYTYAGLNFNINKKEKEYLPPVISVVSPRENPMTTYDPNTRIYATIDNVDRSADVTFSVNGRPAGFTFRREKLSGGVVLEPGINEIFISAYNLAGSDSKKLIIYLQETAPPPVVHHPGPQIYPLVVRITKPAYDVFTSPDEILRLEATVRYVTSRRGIRVLVNGHPENFQFNTSTGQLVSRVRLRKGKNRIQINADNRTDHAEDRITVYFEEARENAPPFVRITAPNDGSITHSEKVEITADIQEIADYRDIQLSVNNRIISNFRFDSDRLSAEVLLQEGFNKIRLTAENNVGTASDEVSIVKRVRRVEKTPPVVSILTPKDGHRAASSGVLVEAEILHVKFRKDIQLRLNNRPITDFDFANGKMRVQLVLKEGINNIHIRASNRDGRDEATISVRYFKTIVEKKPPRVNILKPSDRSTFTTSYAPLKASVTNVSSGRNIRLTINGKSTNKFSFKNGVLTTAVRLQQGKNAIRVEASNKDGRDSKQISIIYKKPVPAPVVNILAPADGTRTTVDLANFKAKVKNIENSKAIQLLINGKHQRFVYNNREGEVTASLRLKKGYNRIAVTAENETGKASDEIVVQYIFRDVVTPDKVDINKEKPEIEITGITQPVIDPMNPQRARSTVNATIKHIDGPSDIELYFNNKPTSQFSFDKNSGVFQATFFLQPGDNIFLLKAKNEAGTTELKRIINLNVKGDDDNPVKDNPGGRDMNLEGATPIKGSVSRRSNRTKKARRSP